MKIRCKDGRIANVELSLNFVDIGEGFFYCFLHDVTEKKLAEKALKERERELKIKSRTLEETNAALRHLLKRREADKSELEENISRNVKELIDPYIEKMKNSSLGDTQRMYMEILEKNLNDIVSPFIRTFASALACSSAATGKAVRHRNNAAATMIRTGFIFMIHFPYFWR